MVKLVISRCTCSLSTIGSPRSHEARRRRHACFACRRRAAGPRSAGGCRPSPGGRCRRRCRAARASARRPGRSARIARSRSPLAEQLGRRLAEVEGLLLPGVGIGAVDLGRRPRGFDGSGFARHLRRRARRLRGRRHGRQPRRRRRDDARRRSGGGRPGRHGYGRGGGRGAAAGRRASGEGDETRRADETAAENEHDGPLLFRLSAPQPGVRPTAGSIVRDGGRRQGCATHFRYDTRCQVRYTLPNTAHTRERPAPEGSVARRAVTAEHVDREAWSHCVRVARFAGAQSTPAVFWLTGAMQPGRGRWTVPRGSSQ